MVTHKVTAKTRMDKGRVGNDGFIEVAGKPEKTLDLIGIFNKKGTFKGGKKCEGTDLRQACPYTKLFFHFYLDLIIVFYWGW